MCCLTNSYFRCWCLAGTGRGNPCRLLRQRCRRLIDVIALMLISCQCISEKWCLQIWNNRPKLTFDVGFLLGVPVGTLVGLLVGKDDGCRIHTSMNDMRSFTLMNGVWCSSVNFFIDNTHICRWRSAWDFRWSFRRLFCRSHCGLVDIFRERY